MRAILKNPLFLSLICACLGQSNSKNSTGPSSRNGYTKEAYHREEIFETVKAHREKQKVQDTGFCYNNKSGR